MTSFLSAAVLLSAFLGSYCQNDSPPSNVRVQGTTATRITLVWDPAINATDYQALYKKKDDLNNIWHNKLSGNASTIEIDGLQPYTVYLVQVLVIRNSVSSNKSEILEVQTDQAQPSGIPKITRFTGTSSSIYLEWNPIPKDQENGPLLGYHVFYINAADIGDYTNKYKKITVEARRRNATITGLHGFTVYHFGVLAFNSKGFDSKLVSVKHVKTLRTEEGVPSKPEGLSAEFTTPSNLSISWKPVSADKANGILRNYRYIVSEGNNVKVNKTASNTSSHVIISSLDACREYVIKVAASTGAGTGNFSQISLGNSCPRITYFKPLVIAKAYTFVVLPCNFTGLNNSVSVEWILKDDIEPLKPGFMKKHTIHTTAGLIMKHIIHYNNGSLVIDFVESIDEGLYQCRVQSKGGSDSANTSLVVGAESVVVTFTLNLHNLTNVTDLEDLNSQARKDLTSRISSVVLAMYNETVSYKVEGVQVTLINVQNDKVSLTFFVSASLNSTRIKYSVEENIVDIMNANTQAGRLGSLYVSNLIVDDPPPPPLDLVIYRRRPTYVILRWKTPKNDKLYKLDGYSIKYRHHGEKDFKTAKTVKNDGPVIYGLLDGLDSGKEYVARVVSHRSTGTSNRGTDKEFKTPNPMLNAILLNIVFPIALALIAVLLFCVVLRKTCHDKEEHELANIQMSQRRQIREENPYNIGRLLQEFPCRWKELSRSDLVVGKELGAGAFGTVVRADLKMNDKKVPCAIKMLKPYATDREHRDLFNELSIMAQVGYNPNVISLLGACTTNGPLWVVVKLAENGSLIEYLHEHRIPDYVDHSYMNVPGSSQDTNEVEPLNKLQKLKFAHGIGKGMSHLEKMKCVHRDLASRNVLLGKHLVPMVSDFGLSRDIYESGMYEDCRGGKRPVRWMAPESIEDYTCTTKSDVWSFGITLWEIETAGTIPYAGIESGMDILNELKKGYRLEQPPSCEDDVYEVIQSCWRANPLDRPSFKDLTSGIEEMLTGISEYLEIHPEDEYQEVFTSPYDEVIINTADLDSDEVPNGDISDGRYSNLRREPDNNEPTDNDTSM